MIETPLLEERSGVFFIDILKLNSWLRRMTMKLQLALNFLSRILMASLYLPILVGLALLGAITINAPFRYLDSACINIYTCLVDRVVVEMWNWEFWRFILAMWVCNLLVVFGIFFRSQRRNQKNDFS